MKNSSKKKNHILHWISLKLVIPFFFILINYYFLRLQFSKIRLFLLSIDRDYTTFSILFCEFSIFSLVGRPSYHLSLLQIKKIVAWFSFFQNLKRCLLRKGLLCARGSQSPPMGVPQATHVGFSLPTFSWQGGLLSDSGKWNPTLPLYGSHVDENYFKYSKTRVFFGTNSAENIHRFQFD